MKVRVCPDDPRLADEVRPTLDSSRTGLSFTTLREDYQVGQKVDVFFPHFRSSQSILRASFARVVRVERQGATRWGVALMYLLR